MKGRDFLKANWNLLEGFRSDQSKGMKNPPVQKPVKDGAEKVSLPDPEDFTPGQTDIRNVIDARRSIRNFPNEPLTMEELSWLLWTTQGIQKVLGDGKATLRRVPSGGARHPFETYLMVFNVTGLEPGIYRYLPLDHSLEVLDRAADKDGMIRGCHGQTFCGESCVTFVWSVIPYRTEWRYGPVSHKVIALDAGHLCQNLYLACTAAELGTCAIGAYDQNAMDDLMGFDGMDEYTIYIAPVGRKSPLE